MKRIVTPISACVVLSLTAAPALARTHSHHHGHAVTAKHFSHHHFARYSHARHWHHRRYAVQQPVVQPFAPFGANPFGWQQPGAQPAPFVAQAPVRRQRLVAQPATFGWQPQPAQPTPFGWQEQAVAPRRHFAAARDAAAQGQFASLVSSHARANGLPESLVHRVIMRESRYNPRAVSKGNYGIMQIRLGTARAMGYTGSAAGLLDANTNMTYAVRYLAGAYRAAGGNQNRAVSYYAGGYYGAAKRAGFSAYAMAQPNTVVPQGFAQPAAARYGAQAYGAAAYAAPVRSGAFRQEVY